MDIIRISMAAETCTSEIHVSLPIYTHFLGRGLRRNELFVDQTDG